tara:strand:- start:162 stop:1403 length:1242 start_codon:yes stop_codon:yes gene_type:complete
MSVTVKSKYEIIVVGSGINGMLMSLLLAKNGFDVCLLDSKNFDKNNINQFSGRSYSIIDSSIYMLENLGVWDYLLSKSQIINNVIVETRKLNEKYSNSFIKFNSVNISDKPMGYIVEERYFKESLYKEFKKLRNLDVYYNKKISKISRENNYNFLEIHNSDNIKCNLLIGADGKNSFVGKSFGINRIKYDFNQMSIVGAVKHEKSHFGNAFQIFYPGGPFAILPLKNNISSFVWTNKKDHMKKFQDFKALDYFYEIEKRFNGILGKISLTGETYSFPLFFNISESIIDKRLALIGEAANSIHPIAGQGLNLGLRDVATLSEVVTEAKIHGEDYGSVSVLERYKKWRSLDRLSVSFTTTLANSFFSGESRFLNSFRNSGMRLVNKSNLLKDTFCKEAMGANGDLPKIMKEKVYF